MIQIRYFILALMLVALSICADAQTVMQRDGIHFTENRGQVVDTRGSLRPDILYTAGSRGVTLFLRNTGISYLFTHVEGLPDTKQMLADPTKRSPFPDSGVKITTYRMDMELV